MPATKTEPTAASSTALARINVTEQFPALANASQIAQNLRETLGDEEFSDFDLERIRIPTGGATAFQIPTITGAKTVEEVTGVVLHIASRRVYWSSPDPSGTPPDCRSDDLEHGIGNPGGECAKCPLNSFGSQVKANGKAGRGKACKEMRLVFILRPKQVLPSVIVVTPGSLKSLKGWRMELFNLQTPYIECVSRFTLQAVKNKDNIGYSQVVGAVLQRLAPEEAGQLRDYAAALRNVFTRAKVDAGDAEE